VTKEDNDRMVKQLRELCTLLPGISQNPELQRLRVIYERGGKHMLDSENLHRIVAKAREHMRELRKLSRLGALECRANLMRHSQQSRD
jgi:hypothetical protein